MPETMTERVGKYDVRVALCAPAKDEEHHQRRSDALAAWLLAQWQTQQTEVEHGDACAAG